MDIQSIVLAAIPALVVVGIQWGMSRQEMKNVQELLKELRENHEGMKEKVVMKEHCRDAHSRADRDSAELKADVKEIKNLLLKWMYAHGGEGESR